MIKLENINKTYNNGSPLHVLKGIDLDVEKGELVSIMGASGSGKSTLLNILGILDDYDSGSYYLAGRLIKNLSETQAAAARNNMIGYIFQSFNLINYKNAVENVALPLYYQGVSRRKRNALALEYLDMLGLREWADHMPNEMSGGQKQRVALARALAVEPQILLLDEPFGALDAQVRKELRRWLRQLHEELKFTSVFVTHDQEEATEVADRVVVMSQGNIEQADAPNQVWREPATRFVLEFMGEVNRLQGTIRGGQFHVGAHRWPLGYTPAYQGPVDLFLRPWEVDISRRTSLDSPLPVQVLEASPKGHYTQLVVQPLGWYNEPLTVVMHGDDAPQRGERLFVGLQHARLYNGDERIETRDEELALAQSA